MYVNIYIPIIYPLYIYIHNFPLILLFCLGHPIKFGQREGVLTIFPAFTIKYSIKLLLSCPLLD